MENENKNVNKNENPEDSESLVVIPDELLKINDLTSFDEDENENKSGGEKENKVETSGEITENTETDDEYYLDFAYAPAPVASEKRIRYLPVHICAFAIPVILMLIAFYTIDLFPFNLLKEQTPELQPKQIMVIDSWHQYFPFLQELQYKLTHFDSVLYSWNTGAGTNFLTLMAYYASTPLYIFSAFVPTEYLREFMMIITAVKIGCSGLFFSVYLRGLHSRAFKNKIADKRFCPINNGFIIIGFSVLYALSAYAVGYYWCIMWLDCMALLPLVILGLERFMDSGKYKLYVISIGLMFICDFYIAIFICEFIALYYVILYFSKTKTPTVKNFIGKTLKTIAISAIGVGLSMFILLPTYLWFGNTGNSGSSFGRDIDTYNTLFDIITNLLPNTTPAIRGGLPNVACGLLAVIFAGLFFMNSKIRLKEKLFTAGFLVFMLFSFNLNILDYYWHGMHFPNEIPYRQAFVFSFVLVTIAYKSYINFDAGNISKSTVMKFCLCIFGYLIVAEQWYKSGDKFDFNVFYVSAAILIFYMAALMLYKHNRFAKSYFAIILMFAMIFEGGMAAVKGASTTGNSDRDSYPPSGDAVRETVRQIYESDEDKFFRLEMSRWYSTNDPVLYGYRGISQFSSMANSKFARTLEVMGLAANIPSNRFLYSSATPVFNMFLSLKYLMAREEYREHDINSVSFDEYLRITDENNEITRVVTAYKNKYWLPIGFVVSEDINQVKVTETNIFITQNEMMKKSTGITEDVFKSIQQLSNTNVNLNETMSAYGMYSYRMNDTSRVGTINHVYKSETTQQVYIYLRSTRTSSSKSTKVSVNGVEKTYEVNRGMMIDCGTVLAGQEINVSFEVEAGTEGSFQLFVAGFDEEVFKQGYDILNSRTLNIETFEDTKITGTVTVQEDGILFTSIPYDKGWHIKIDGKKAEINPMSEAEMNDVPKATDANAKDEPKPDPRQITKITDGFITAPITAGEHTVELYYITDGLVPGAIISLLCVAALVVLEIITRKIRKKNSKLMAVLETASEKRGVDIND